MEQSSQRIKPLEPHIVLFGVGGVGRDILIKASRFLVGHCPSIRVTIESVDDADFALNEDRGQYDAKKILRELERRLPENALKGIGVTWHDLFLPMLSYVYGTAQVEGRCAVFSLRRLHPGFYSPKETDNVELFDCRIEKTLLHEIAHTFGLTHCHSPECVMFSSCRIEDTDCKNSHFCPSCAELFQWMIEKALGLPPQEAPNI